MYLGLDYCTKIDHLTTICCFYSGNALDIFVSFGVIAILGRLHKITFTKERGVRKATSRREGDALSFSCLFIFLAKRKLKVQRKQENRQAC